MNKVLVAGVDSIVGGNLAVSLGRTHSVAGVSLSGPVTLAGCDVESYPGCGDHLPELLNRVKPARIVYCGAATQTGWDGPCGPNDDDVRTAQCWIKGAHDAGIQLTLMSSSSVFTGPWMFHSENSQSYCASPSAQRLLAIETAAAEMCPGSLLIRSHAFGWQPGGNPGWIESLLNQLAVGQSAGLDCFRYASPILVSDLAEIISRAWAAGLSGLYHIAGAERANPVQFARRLAHHFQLPIPAGPTGEALIDRPQGFGCGETSLQTRKIRRALHISLPMLDEGVQRLFQQHADGYRSRLTGHSHVPGSKVA